MEQACRESAELGGEDVLVSRRRADGTVPRLVFSGTWWSGRHDRDWWGVAPHRYSGPDPGLVRTRPSYLARTNLHFYQETTCRTSIDERPVREQTADF
jgi:hypothetical protein